MILRKYEHNDNKSKHGTLKKSKIRRVAENSANTEGKIIRRKGESHRDALRPCSRVSSDGRTRVSSGGRTSRETN